MGQFSVEKPGLPGSVLNGNQQKGAGLVSITLHPDGGVTHFQIAFTPIDAAFAIGEGIKKTVSDKVDRSLFR